jgi:hypothetical protein
MAVNDGQYDRRPNLSGGSDTWDEGPASPVLLEDYFPTEDEPPSPATGTIAVTEANDTSAATGAITVSGAIAVTEANDTSAATGAITVTGATTATEANDIVDAVGGVEGADPDPPTVIGGGGRPPMLTYRRPARTDDETAMALVLLLAV